MLVIFCDFSIPLGFSCNVRICFSALSGARHIKRNFLDGDNYLSSIFGINYFLILIKIRKSATTSLNDDDSKYFRTFSLIGTTGLSHATSHATW